MYNKVKDKETEKKENKNTKPIYMLCFALTMILLTIIYTYLAIALDKKVNGPKEVKPGHEEKYSCEIVDGEYWGKEYEKVDKETYEKECTTPKTYRCKVINGEYWGKNYKVVDYETYKKDCIKPPTPKTYSCKVVNGEYWGKNYEIVDEETYNNECATPIIQYDWKIVFDNVKVKEGSVSASLPEISSTKTALSYEVLLGYPGEYYSFDVDIVNKGDIDAKIYNTVMKNLTTQQKKYLEYTIKYKDGTDISIGDTLLTGQTRTITIWLKFRDDMTDASDLPSSDDSLKLDYEINYEEK